MTDTNEMFCANLKEVKKMSEAFIREWGVATLRRDYEKAVEMSEKMINSKQSKT